MTFDQLMDHAKEIAYLATYWTSASPVWTEDDKVPDTRTKFPMPSYNTPDYSHAVPDRILSNKKYKFVKVHS